MREVNIGSKKYTKIVCLDEPGAGGACHEYIVGPAQEIDKQRVISNLAVIHLQNGPIKENGVNGCHNEDLIAIVIDRLQYFQAGEYSCRENAIALTKLEEALLWLRKRTQDRIDRGVEDTSVK